MKPYEPISCATHSELELLAMHRSKVELKLEDGARVQGQIVDVFTAKGAEYARIETADGQQDVRLDLIRTFNKS